MSERGAGATRAIRSLPVAALIVATLFAAANPANALSGGEYIIKKSTIDGGGMTFHTGEAYRLGGTVGQHDAAKLTGGDYKLTGGFWSPVIPPVPASDPTGMDKSRFISFSIPTSAFAETALSVTLTSLHHVDPPYTGGASVPFTAFEGQVRWVGPPTQFIESNSNPITFYASFLQCAPEYRDWSTVGLLHVTGSAIVPSSTYDVENLAGTCTGNEANCTAVSAPLTISTTRWGDVMAAFQDPNAPASQPDFNDIGALVDKFKSALGAPIKARAALAGSVPDLGPDIGFAHISTCVDAFKGLPYPYTIASCP